MIVGGKANIFLAFGTGHINLGDRVWLKERVTWRHG